MRLNLRKIMLLVSCLTVVGGTTLAPAPAAALFEDSKQAACEGVQLNDAVASCPDTTKQINSLLETTINIFSLVIGFIAVIMLFIGGLKYITSTGDSNNLTSAKNTILYAIIGLVIATLAQIIVRFVLEKI